MRVSEVLDNSLGVRMHIALLPKEKVANHVKQLLQEKRAELLGDLKLEIREIDFGAGKSILCRVEAGPVEYG